MREKVDEADNIRHCAMSVIEAAYLHQKVTKLRAVEPGIRPVEVVRRAGPRGARDAGQQVLDESGVKPSVMSNQYVGP